MIRRIGDEINKTLQVVTASMKDTTWSFNAREPIPISVREKLLLALGDLKVEANRTRQLVNSEQATTMKLLRTLNPPSTPDWMQRKFDGYAKARDETQNNLKFIFLNCILNSFLISFSMMRGVVRVSVATCCGIACVSAASSSTAR